MHRREDTTDRRWCTWQSRVFFSWCQTFLIIYQSRGIVFYFHCAQIPKCRNATDYYFESLWILYLRM